MSNEDVDSAVNAVDSVFDVKQTCGYCLRCQTMMWIVPSISNTDVVSADDVKRIRG